MKKEYDSSTDEESSENNICAYTLRNIENIDIKEYPTLPLYDYPEPNLDTLSPICYGTVQQPELKLELYHEETLFYIFYTYTETSAQLKAYNLLIEKGYLFSTTFKCFILFTGKKICDNTNRKIIVFDPFYWKKIEKSVIFDKSFVDSIKGVLANK